MHPIKLAAAVINTTPLDWSANLDSARAAIAEARQQGVSILCLPELCLSGYGCEDAFHFSNTLERSWQSLQSILPDTAGMVVSVGLPVLHRNAVYNSAALLVDGQIAGFVAKQHLAGDGIHYEPRWFKPWPAGVVSTLEVAGQSFPIGDLFFDVSGVRIGFEICEDAWVANRPGAGLALQSADIILNPSASHFAFGKLDIRKRFVLEGSRAFGVTYVYANLLGNEAGRAIYDGGAIIASGGKPLAIGPRFSFKPWLITTAVADLDATRLSQARAASFSPASDCPPGRCVRVNFDIPRCPMALHEPVQAGWETGPHVKEEEFARAEALALFDYARKSRSNGFVISLSGGADSSALASLLWIMNRLAAAELGTQPAMDRLLTTVYQSTANSGPVTRDAARAVSSAIGARHLELDVSALVDGYINTISNALGRKLTWETDDIALQNIQARVRAPSVWMIANLNNALLLATSNRSEAAVGYATMDGDTSGGLSPLAGIDKNYLRRWLAWLRDLGPEGLGPLPAIEAVTAQQPTAELRPPDQHQTDEDDLMPYDILDTIERLAIGQRHAPAEVLQLLQLQYSQYTLDLLKVWVTRFFLLWSRNQWKRERYAPSFHLDDQNLDPKTWCRFPILSGGFRDELAAL